MDRHRLQPATSYSLQALGKGLLPVIGCLHTSVDLDFARLFSHDFHVCDIKFGILGADFLSRHKLIVDVIYRPLTESIEVERCSPSSELEPDPSFEIQTNDKTNPKLLNSLQKTFPEVFDPCRRNRGAKHSVVASVQTSTEELVFARTRRLSPEKFRALRDELKRLCDQGILENSHSAWTSPIVMVRKKSGTWRLCADFTNLNKILQTRKYALPYISDFTALAHGCSIFSSIDISDAYYNLPIKPEDKHKLTITTPLGNYSYNYLPMGLATSSTYFQQLMNEALAGIPQVFCYLDDVIVMSHNPTDHKRTLNQVFTQLRDHGLVVNQDNCVFGVNSLSFLGFKVSEQGFSPLPAKVLAINDFSLPRTKRQLNRISACISTIASLYPITPSFSNPFIFFPLPPPLIDL